MSKQNKFEMEIEALSNKTQSDRDATDLRLQVQSRIDRRMRIWPYGASVRLYQEVVVRL